MSRRRGRANLRTGLWQDLPGEGFVPAEHLAPEAETSPRRYPCRRTDGGCGAATGEPCTSPSRRPGGRRPISGYHEARLKQIPTSHPANPAPDQENP
ncbi:zinc finger domain-containing protein [Amycolatopsis thailandensis]